MQQHIWPAYAHVIHLSKGGNTMKPTGIARRIDNLGRIVIPKEIRKNLRINPGTPLEIFIDNDGGIIFKKFSPFDDICTFAADCVDSLNHATGHITCIVDKDQVIAVSGKYRKDFLDKTISPALERAIERGRTVTASRREVTFVPVLLEDDEDNVLDLYNNELIAPIRSGSDVVGAVVFLAQNKTMGELENKLATAAAEFLGKQI